MRRNILGFSLLEMSIGLVIVGVIAGISTPSARLYANHFKHVKEKLIIKELNKSVIGYAMTRGGFPDSAAGDLLPSTNIGMSSLNSYDMEIQYYVNTLLNESTTLGNFTTLCDTAKNILDGTTVSTTPAICNEVSATFVNCADSSVVAFVLVSSGENKAKEHENGDGDQAFENPTKKPNAVEDYDDVVTSYGLAELANECQTL